MWLICVRVVVNMQFSSYIIVVAGVFHASSVSPSPKSINVYIKAECEAETKETNDTNLLSMEDYDERGNNSDDGATDTNGRVEIRPDHIAKIAAELLLDW